MIILGDKTIRKLYIGWKKRKSEPLPIKRVYLGEKLIYEYTVTFRTDRKYTKGEREIIIPKLTDYRSIEKMRSQYYVKINDYPEVLIKGITNKGFLFYTEKYDWFPDELEANTKVVVRFRW